MALLQFDMSTLINQAIQIHHMSGTTPVTEIVAEFSDVCRDQMGVLERIEATIVINDSAVPRFHKPRLITFVTGFRKTDPNCTFGISRITNLKYLTHCESLLLCCSHAIFAV